MSASLRAFLTGLIDYAGLFPPAGLSLPEALANYVRYRSSSDGWMLGRFICPAARLGEMSALADLFRTGPPLVVAALGRGGATGAEFLAGLRDDLSDIASCRQRHPGRIVIDVMEVRLPADLPAARAAIVAAAEATQQAGLTLFFETPLPDRQSLSELLRLIHETPFASPAGFKLRTGGLAPPAFPASLRVAVALKACLAEGVPFKATAGLHHPLPRFDPAVQARMHGFVNLFAAGVLVHARGINAEQVRTILEDTQADYFRFTDEEFEWPGLTASTEEIARARQKAVLSFGSCSFEEPCDELRSLGWL